jgi:hypothetical protein
VVSEETAMRRARIVRRSVLTRAMWGCWGLAGCSKAESPGLYPVRGQVFVAGKPAANAFIVLHPLSVTASDAPRPRGRVDEQGNFVVGTQSADDGAPPGEYAVTIQWFDNRRAKEGDDRGPNASSDLLRGRYSNPSHPKALRVRVEPRANELPPFKL